ncbi:hypothetical protein LCGC14_1477690 [marine sediment metagenome]|uniref:HTH cro/C1-type domain-containing protein n=1 Tax=marine sediment metagenome TaxID=412755 RepID=A0A0F9JB83_9ZZZZ
MSEFGDGIALLREQSGQTLQQVADGTCMTKSYIWELENKPNIRPSAVTARKLSKHFGVTVEFLLGFECWERAADKAFFERYLEANEDVRRQVRDILSVLEPV